jgi:hypothetical protein
MRFYVDWRSKHANGVRQRFGIRFIAHSRKASCREPSSESAPGTQPSLDFLTRGDNRARHFDCLAVAALGRCGPRLDRLPKPSRAARARGERPRLYLRPCVDGFHFGSLRTRAMISSMTTVLASA